jgi:hypothetical protein
VDWSVGIGDDGAAAPLLDQLHPHVALLHVVQSPRRL